MVWFDFSMIFKQTQKIDFFLIPITKKKFKGSLIKKKNNFRKLKFNFKFLGC